MSYLINNSQSYVNSQNLIRSFSSNHSEYNFMNQIFKSEMNNPVVISRNITPETVAYNMFSGRQTMNPDNSMYSSVNRTMMTNIYTNTNADMFGSYIPNQYRFSY